MRLTLVISSLSSGGAEKVLSGLANHWAGQGHGVTLLTFSGASEVPFYPLNSDIHLKPLGIMLPQKASGLVRLGYILKRLMKLRQALRQSKADVIVSFVDITNLTTLLASLGLGARVVVSERTHPGHHHIPLLYQWLRFVLYRIASKVIVQTQSAAAYFKRIQTLIIPNAVAPALTTATLRKEVRHIVSVGRLCSSKGFGDLIQAFAKVVEEHHLRIELTIYGEGDDRERLEALIQSLHLDHQVHLPGQVSNIVAKLADADLFVFPSHYEGFPNALCESMSVGLPVIASACSGNVDIVRDRVDGLLFPVGNVSMLSSLMLHLINDVTARKGLSKHAMMITHRFDQKSILLMWDDIINKGIKA